MRSVSKNKQPKCSIVIRCYNEEKHIGKLLNGILQQSIEDKEIIVVDSGSTDSTLSVALTYPVKILSIKPGEFSFGRSLNIGCNAARGEYIVMASAHVYPVYKDWLKQLLDPFSNPRISLVYGKQRGHQRTRYSEHQVFAKWFPAESKISQNDPFCNNANSAIRREIWKKIPYDESLTGLEDIDWAKKTMELGYNIAYQADAEIIHVHNETPRQTYNRYRREAIALRHIFPNERFDFRDFSRLLLINILTDYKQSIHDGVFGKQWVGIPKFRIMQFLGTYHGFYQRSPITNSLKHAFYYPNHKKAWSEKNQPTDKDRPLVDY